MKQDVSVFGKALAAAVLAVALFAAVLVQLTVVNRVPLPGSVAPDLVLLLVAAIAVATGPATGAVTGFLGGLALDIAPPAAHYAGEYALVFCLVGYAAARAVQVIWDTTGDHDPVIIFTVMAAAVAAGEAGKAALGMLLSDPNVTGAAVSRVLPAAILYDLLLSPLVFWLVGLVTRGAVGWRAARGRPSEFGAFQPALVFRQAAGGGTPKLRLSGTGGDYRSPSAPPRRVPKLRLAGTHSPASLRTTSAASPSSPLALAGGRTPKLHLARNRPSPAARPAPRTPGRNWLSSSASAAVPAQKRAISSPSRGWLRAAGPAGGQASGRRSVRTGASPRKFANGTGGTASSLGGMRSPRSAAEALAARSAPSGVSALSGAGTPLARRRSPSRGWLRGSGSAGPAVPSQRLSPRGGWLGSASRPRTVIGSGVGPRSRRPARGNWYTASPSGAWLRRGRHPWRKRSRRLLRLVGVGR